MADPVLPNPFDTPPTAEEYYARSAASLAENRAAAQAQLATLNKATVPVAAPVAPPEPAPDLYAPYREQPKATYDIYKPGSNKDFYRVPLDDLLARRSEQDPDGNAYGDYTVTVKDPTGARRGVAVRDLDHALAEGFSLENAQQGAVQRFLNDNKGLKGDAKAALLSYSDQLFLGIPSTVAEHVLSPEERANIEALRAEHEFANIAGGVAGFAGSMLVGGPLFKAAGAAGGMAAGAVERVLAARLAAQGAEAAVAKPLAARILANAARLGTESAVIAAPEVVTEAALGDPAEAAETLAYSIGAGAALGTVGTGAKGLFERAAKSVFQPSESIVGKLEGYANEQAIKSHNPYKRISDRLAEVPGGEQAAGKILREHDLVRRTGESFEDLTTRIEDTADTVGKEIDNVYKALDEKGVVYDARELAKEMRREILEPLTKKVGFEAKVAKVEKYIESFEGKMVGEPLDPPRLRREPTFKEPKPLSEADVLASLKEKHKGFGLRFAPAHREAFLREAEGGTLAELTAKANAERLAAAEAAHAEKLASIAEENARRVASHERRAAQQAEVKAGDLRDIRRDLDDLIYGEKLPSPDQVDEQFKAIRGLFKKELDTKVSEVLGEETAAQLKKLNADYHVLDIVAKGAQKNIGRDITNRGNSITDYLLGAGTSGVGALAGALVGGPLGALAGGGAAKLVGMFGNKYLRENYNSMAVRGAEKLGILFTEQAQRQTAQQLDRVQHALGLLESGSTRAAAEARDFAELTGIPGTRHERFKVLRDQLAEAQANTDATATRMADLSAGLAEGGAPNVGRETMMKQQQILAYLAREAPRAAAARPFGGKEPTPSERELIEYERKVEAAYDPIGTITRHLARGTLTRTHVETVKELYPGTYRKVAERIQRTAADPKAPKLSTPAFRRIQALFGSPQATPADMKRYQDAYNQPMKGRPSGPGIDKLPSPETEVQRITGG